MKKLLAIVVLSLLFNTNVFAEILFRAECENPKGVRYSQDIYHLQNDKINTVEFEKDKFSGSDTIELIYDTSNQDQIQFIWGSENKFEKLYAYNEKFYHWGFVDKNFANGFYWGHWSFSLPNKLLTYYKGNSSSTGSATGLATSIFSSRCIVK
tara:strand:+ start:42 stop:500 length:459 start_codon:yes stop_codon:yes gene_type:complete